jgi:CcmD family protein
MNGNTFLEAGVAIYVALAVALSVWIGIFIYLWRLDGQARELKRELERDRAQVKLAAEQTPATPRATVTRVSAPVSDADAERLRETVKQ